MRTHILVPNSLMAYRSNPGHCKDMVEHSVGIITALVSHFGYDKAAEIAKNVIDTGFSVRKLI